MATVLALDGGNSKTDLLLVDSDGELMGAARAAPFRPHLDGEQAALAALEPAVHSLLLDAGIGSATHAAASLANADRPDEERAFEDGILRRGWAGTASVVNDTLAVLRAGTPAGVGVAVVCGAGINGIGVDERGGVVRFPALGPLTGDWGGGQGLAEQVLWWSVRAEDGRGPRTALAEATAAHFGLGSATACAIAVHFGDLDGERLHELVPLLFEVAASGDPVAGAVLTRQAEEIVTLVAVCVGRLEFPQERIPVVLGGGVLAARHPQLIDPVVEGIHEVDRRCDVEVLAAPPVLGAALSGLDFLNGGSGAARGTQGQDRPAESRLRERFPAPTRISR